MEVKRALALAYNMEFTLTMVNSNKEEFGDYQCNAGLLLAKRLQLKPREIAENLMSTINLPDIISKMDISGPGFINIHLSHVYIKQKILTMLQYSDGAVRLGIPKARHVQRVIIDFSSPNIAKEMHVVSSIKMFLMKILRLHLNLGTFALYNTW